MNDIYQCDYCTAIFSTVVDIEGHIYSHLKGKEDDFTIQKKSEVKNSNKDTSTHPTLWSILSYFESKTVQNNNKGQNVVGNVNTNVDSDDVEDTHNTYVDEVGVISRNNHNIGKCCICLQPFATCFDYTNHAEKESVTMEIQCPICHFYFENIDALENHRHQNCCHKLSGIAGKDNIEESNIDHNISKHTANNMRAGTAIHVPNQTTKYTSILCLNAKWTDMSSLKCRVCEKVVCHCFISLENNEGAIQNGPFTNYTETKQDVSQVTDTKTNKNSSFKCSRCDKVFYNLSEWLVHDETHPEDKPFRCIICKTQFMAYRNYLRHRTEALKHEDTDNDSQQHRCPTCEDKFKTARKLLKHYEMHMDLRPYKCSVCQCKFSSPDQLKDHKRNHSRYSSRCTQCKVSSFHKRQHHILHTTEHHKGSCFVCMKRIPKLFHLKHHVAAHFGFTQCLSCNTSFNNKVLLARHMPCTFGILSCEICGERFSDVKTLTRHVKEHGRHGGSDLKGRPNTKVLCEICGTVCLTIQGLRTHKKKHIKPSNKFKCNICNSHHNSNRGLVMHKTFSHPIKKPLTCTTCSKSVLNKSSLLLHMRHHERIAALKPVIKCDTCDEKFTTISQLTRHSNVHMYDTKPYKCDQCEVAFAQNCNLTKHKLIHSEERPYACDKCDASFNHRSNLNRHRQIHTGDFSYRCKVCSFGFASRCMLLDHQKVHDGLKLYTS